MELMDFTLDHLDQITVTDLEEYMEYLKYRFNDHNQEITNKERGIMRKISSLKSFYNYFFRTENSRPILLPSSSSQSSTKKKSSVWM